MFTKFKYPLLYILLYACIGFYAPYFALYIKEIGFTGQQISYILSIQILSAILILPIWNVLGNRFNIHRKIIMIFLLLCSLVIFTYTLTNNMLVICVITVLYQIFFISIQPKFDNLCVLYTKENNKDFGRLRLFGSIGFIIGSFIGGYTYKYFGFNFNIYIISILYVILFFVFKSTKIKFIINKRIHHSEKLYNNRGFVLFIVFQSIIFGVYCVNNNLFGYFYEYHNLGSDILGIITSLTVTAEIITLIVMSKFKKINYKILFIISSLIIVIRYFLIAGSDNLTLIFIYNIIACGFYVGVYLSLYLNTINSLVGKENLTDAITYGNMSLYVSQLIVLLISGYILDVFSIITVYFALGIFVLIGIVFQIPFTLLKHEHKEL